MSTIVKKGELNLAGVLGKICQHVEMGDLPLELLERVAENPWALLRPGEVHESQFGALIPKDVNLESVRVFCDATGDEDRAVGVQNDGTYWPGFPSPGPKKLFVGMRQSDPFLPSSDGVDRVVDLEGRVWSTNGELVATEILSRDPFIGYHAGTGHIITKFERVCPPTECGAPRHAVLSAKDSRLVVWCEYGGIYQRSESSWRSLGAFSMNPGQVLHAVACQAGVTAIVFRFGEGEDATFKLVVLRNGRLVTQTMEEHKHISTPIILETGVVLVRVNDHLMRYVVDRMSEDLGIVQGDPVPVQVKRGDDSVTKVRALCQYGTAIARDVGGLETRLHAPPIAVHEPYVFFAKHDGLVEVAEYLEDGSLRTVHEFADHVEKIIVTASGFRAVAPLRMRGMSRRSLVVMERVTSGHLVGSNPMWIDDEFDVDLRTVVVHDHGIFVVAQRRGDSARSWCVLASGSKSMHEVGKSAHAIFRLRIDGPLLRWYRRDGRMITDARLYIG